MTIAHLLRGTAVAGFLVAASPLAAAPLAEALRGEADSARTQVSVQPAADTDGTDGGTDITVTATRGEKRVEDVPQTVSVIDAKAIDDRLVTDIKDLVRYEPGVAVRRAPARFTAAGAATGRDRDSGFNIRGLEGNRVLITVDGVRVPDGFSFGAQSVGRGDYVDLNLGVGTQNGPRYTLS